MSGYSRKSIVPIIGYHAKRSPSCVTWPYYNKFIMRAYDTANNRFTYWVSLDATATPTVVQPNAIIANLINVCIINTINN